MGIQNSSGTFCELLGGSLSTAPSARKAFHTAVLRAAPQDTLTKTILLTPYLWIRHLCQIFMPGVDEDYAITCHKPNRRNVAERKGA
ncbi:hypothetical protein M6B38_382015 [Iris pallida]|uniref:Uncharacterized protein n=1 Tax=Iris pallida TaxID=29817 RepID=A0AAX6E5F2_IRIPA|nr:hypothetical protein M6B38_209440 [Iris pallida]KAJ6824535.1 hypothetical protein M6B38_382015 [Iris pallida]